MDDDEGTPISRGYTEWDDERRARYDAARERVATAINDCVQIMREDEHAADPPFIQGWIAAAEWTNIAAERENWGGRDIVAPHGQMLSVGQGLSVFAANRHL